MKFKVNISRADLWAVCALVVLIFGLFSINIATRTYPVDSYWIEIAQTHMGLKTFIRNCVGMGRFPLWIPNMALGYPGLAHTHFFLFYPPAVIFDCMDFMPAMAIYLIFHLIFLAGACYGLMRSFGAEPAGSFFGAFSMACGGYVVFNIGYVPVMSTFVWTPLIIWIIAEIIRKIRLNLLLLLIIAAAIQFMAGDLEMALYQWVFVLFGIITVRIFARDQIKNWNPVIALSLIGILIGLMVAIQLIPTIELFSQSDRKAGFQLVPLKESLIRFSSTSAAAMAGFFFPIPILSHCFNLGFLAWAFGIWGWLKSDRRVRAIIGILFLFCLINAIQHLSPLQRFFNLLPLLKGFRFPIRFLFFAQLLMCMAAAWGIDRFLDVEHRRDERPATPAMPIWMPVGLTLYGIVWLIFGPTRLVGTLILVLAFVSLAWVTGWPTLLLRRPNWVFGFVSALLLVDPYISTMQSLPRNSRYIMEPFPEVLQLFKENQKPPHEFSRSIIIAYTRESRFMSGEELAWGGYTPACNASLYTQRYFSYFSLMVPGAFIFDKTHDNIIKTYTYDFFMNFYAKELLGETSLPWIDLIGTRYLLLRHHDLKLGGDQFQRIHQGEVDIYENRQSYPRAFYAYEPKTFPGFKDVFKFMRANSSLDFRRILLVESPLGNTLDQFSAPENENLPEITQYLPDIAQIEAHPTSPAYMVLTDTYYPGWKAFVDGKEARIIPADGAFRAITITPGSHKIVFKYQPVPFRIGLWITLACLLAMGLIYVRRSHLW